jgi:hypothetical protein
MSATDEETAALVLAHFFGIDIETEGSLVSIARQALERLPAGWEYGVGEGENAGDVIYIVSSL